VLRFIIGLVKSSPALPDGVCMLRHSVYLVILELRIMHHKASISSVKLKLFLDFSLLSRTHLRLITLERVAIVQAIVDDALTKAIKAVKVVIKTSGRL
jgi:hypothetical protein